MGCRCTDQGGGIDLHSGATFVTDHTIDVWHPWVADINHHQTGESFSLGCGEIPRQFAAGPVAHQPAGLG